MQDTLPGDDWEVTVRPDWTALHGPLAGDATLTIRARNGVRLTAAQVADRAAERAVAGHGVEDRHLGQRHIHVDRS
ncbi:hypothetical protein AB5J72_36440 [Streptomyces sp. CG1]|uniref:hypothetical protein n=1 Tax=Streptomyces sp. CG1 TaxID=1287523 RepID=UPI0034E2C9B5